MKEAVANISRDPLDSFEGPSKGYTGWFNIDHEFLKRKISTLELDLYFKDMKGILKFKIWNHI